MPSGRWSRTIALWGKEEGQFFSPSKTPDRVYCFLTRSGELRQGAVSPNGVKPQCGDISEGGGALLGQGAERQLWGRPLGRAGDCILGQVGQRGGKTKEEEEPKCDTTSSGSASEVRLAQLATARAPIHISLSPRQPPTPAPAAGWCGDAARAAPRSSTSVGLVGLSAFPFRKASVIATCSQVEQLEARSGGNHEGWPRRRVDAVHVGTSRRTSPTEILQESSPLLRTQVCPCNSLCQTITSDSTKLSFELFQPYVSQGRMISQFYREETCSKE